MALLRARVWIFVMGFSSMMTPAATGTALPPASGKIRQADPTKVG
jgi:hypothetical protein